MKKIIKELIYKIVENKTYDVYYDFTNIINDIVIKLKEKCKQKLYAIVFHGFCYDSNQPYEEYLGMFEEHEIQRVIFEYKKNVMYEKTIDSKTYYKPVELNTIKEKFYFYIDTKTI
jgi:hypothetical protein